MTTPRPPCIRCARVDGHRARGLCNACYTFLRNNHRDKLLEYPRTYRAAAEVIEEYEFFIGYVCPGATVRTAAQHLGMTRDALQRALERHRRRERARHQAGSEQEEVAA